MVCPSFWINTYRLMAILEGNVLFYWSEYLLTVLRYLCYFYKIALLVRSLEVDILQQ